MPIVADVPSADPALGFRTYAEALADAIRGGHPPQFTIGLYGAWGTGKSSLLAAIRRELEEVPDAVHVVEFDAWRYERTTNIVVPLLHRIAKAVGKGSDSSVRAALENALRAFLFSVRFKLGPVEFDPGRALDAAESDASDRQLDRAFSEPFEAFRDVSAALGSKRIAVLIDDLDRCSPDHVVSVLESINLVMDVPGIVFVLALDYEVLTKAISARYPHVEGELFIQKLIQLPFRVPQVDLTRPNFLQELVPSVTRLSGELPDGFGELIRDVALLGLGGNPRQIKRLLNGYLLLQRILEAQELRLDGDLIVPLLGLQLAWPVDYLSLHDAVVLGKDDPADVLRNEQEDASLFEYMKRFFPKGRWGLADLRQGIQLTEVVGGTEQGIPEATPSSKRSEKFTGFAEALEGMGFRRSARSSRLFYHPQDDSIRVAFTKTKVRLERRNKTGQGRDWQLDESWWISDRAQALTFLRSRTLLLAIRAKGESQAGTGG